MAQRSECLYNGNIIGIESIYTLVDGKKINIPEEVEALRAKSRRKELFCPCRCGANLVLVAGDQNLREQHFRLMHGTAHKECSAVSEGSESIKSKVLLKLWLEDKLNHPEIKYRVPLTKISENRRRFEITLLAPQRNIGISYCYNRINLSDAKLSELESYKGDIRLIMITDIQNAVDEGQYPEWLMKIQNRQGYCLFLSLNGEDYADARLMCGIYRQDLDGLWKLLNISDGPLSEYVIEPDGSLCINGNSLPELASNVINTFDNEQKTEAVRRKKAKEEAFTQEQQRIEAAGKEARRVGELREAEDRQRAAHTEQMRPESTAEKRKEAEERGRIITDHKNRNTPMLSGMHLVSRSDSITCPADGNPVKGTFPRCASCRYCELHALIRNDLSVHGIICRYPLSPVEKVKTRYFANRRELLGFVNGTRQSPL